MSYNNIGDVRWDEGDCKGALAVYEKALAIAERLAAQDPGNAIYERAPSFIYSALADISSMEQDYADAMADARKAIGILEKLIRENRLVPRGAMTCRACTGNSPGTRSPMENPARRSPPPRAVSSWGRDKLG
jgi:tetratricopeptide (TPR) repeat protein